MKTTIFSTFLIASSLALISISFANAGDLKIETDNLQGLGIANATVIVNCPMQSPELPIFRAGVTDNKGVYDAGDLPEGANCSITAVSLTSKLVQFNASVSIYKDQLVYLTLMNSLN